MTVLEDKLGSVGHPSSGSVAALDRALTWGSLGLPRPDASAQTSRLEGKQLPPRESAALFFFGLIVGWWGVDGWVGGLVWVGLLSPSAYKAELWILWKKQQK